MAIGTNYSKNTEGGSNKVIRTKVSPRRVQLVEVLETNRHLRQEKIEVIPCRKKEYTQRNRGVKPSVCSHIYLRKNRFT